MIESDIRLKRTRQILLLERTTAVTTDEEKLQSVLQEYYIDLSIGSPAIQLELPQFGIL